MWKELKAHPFAYTVLIITVIMTVIAFLAAWPQRDIQRGIAVVFGVFYFVWGTVTHLHADHITRRIVLEYASVGFLIAVIMIGLTL